MESITYLDLLLESKSINAERREFLKYLLNNCKDGSKKTLLINHLNDIATHLANPDIIAAIHTLYFSELCDDIPLTALKAEWYTAMDSYCSTESGWFTRDVLNRATVQFLERSPSDKVANVYVYRGDIPVQPTGAFYIGVLPANAQEYLQTVGRHYMLASDYDNIPKLSANDMLVIVNESTVTVYHKL